MFPYSLEVVRMRRNFIFLVTFGCLSAFALGMTPLESAAQKKTGKGKSATTIEVYQTKTQFRFRIVDAKGVKLANANKGYKTKDDVLKIVTAIQKAAAKAKITEAGVKGKMAAFELYKDKGGKFRFRLLGNDGAKLAKSVTGYKTKADVMRIVQAIQSTITSAKIDVKVKK